MSHNHDENPWTPEQIIAEFSVLTDDEYAITDEFKEQRQRLIWALIEDVRSSYRLAIAGEFGDLVEYKPEMLANVETTVADYLSRMYGDD